MRYKEFNTNSVLEKCINLFWKGGFGPCSVKDIVDETGVNRYSLYEEFTNKEGILSAAMKLYVSRYAEPNMMLLSYDGDLEDIIQNFYQSFLKENTNHPTGCFIVHVATEMADHNEDIKTFLDAYLEQIERAFISLLKREGRNEDESALYARHFVTLFCYIMVFSVIRSSEEQNRVIKNEIKLILSKTVNHA